MYETSDKSDEDAGEKNVLNKLKTPEFTSKLKHFMSSNRRGVQVHHDDDSTYVMNKFLEVLNEIIE